MSEFGTQPSDFSTMSTRDLRDWIREARSEYRSELSRRHMASASRLRLLGTQHYVAMNVMRGRA